MLFIDAPLPALSASQIAVSAVTSNPDDSTDEKPKKPKKDKTVEWPPVPWDIPVVFETTQPVLGAMPLATTATVGGLAPDTGFYRVVRNGIYLNLANDALLSGEREIPFEFGNSAQEFSGINLYCDGFAVDGATVETGSGGSMVVKWNTSCMYNGTYSIYLGADCGPEAPMALSPVVTVHIDNDLTFDEFTSTFGSKMWIYAEWKYQQAIDWYVRLYDETGQEIVFRNASGAQVFLGGTSPDGIIDTEWDLTDPASNVITQETIRGDFYVGAPGQVQAQSTGGQSGYSGRWFWKKEVNWR